MACWPRSRSTHARMIDWICKQALGGAWRGGKVKAPVPVHHALHALQAIGQSRSWRGNSSSAACCTSSACPQAGIRRAAARQQSSAPAHVGSSNLLGQPRRINLPLQVALHIGHRQRRQQALAAEGNRLLGPPFGSIGLVLQECRGQTKGREPPWSFDTREDSETVKVRPAHASWHTHKLACSTCGAAHAAGSRVAGRLALRCALHTPCSVPVSELYIRSATWPETRGAR